MTDTSTYVVRLAGWLGEAIGESAPLFKDFSTETLGIELPPAVLTAGPVTSALHAAEGAAKAVGEAGGKVVAAAGTPNNDLKILAAFIELGVGLANFYKALDALVAAVQAAVTPASVPDATARAAAQDLASKLAKRLSDVILASAIADRRPEVGVALRLLGLLDWRRIPKDPANPASRDQVLRTLELDRFKKLISDPIGHYKERLRWGEADFDPRDLFELYAGFWNEEVDVEVGETAGDPFLRDGRFTIRRDRTTNPPGLALEFEINASTEPLGEESRRVLNDQWGIQSDARIAVNGKITGGIKPTLEFRLQPATGSISGELRTYINRNKEARPFDVLGGVGPLSITADDLKAGFGAKAMVDGAGVRLEPLLFAELTKGKIGIGTADADSFLGALLSNVKVDGDFDLALEWSPREGLRARASGGVEIAIPIHKSIGPITFETLYVVLRIGSDGKLSFELSAALMGSLGPLAASVDRIGAILDVRFAEGTDADFGPFDLGLRFKPPNGIGLSVDAGVIKGGGYLYVDTEKGEYAGALELTFSGFLSLKAIGLISTKLPGGQSGFSLLIIITAEFVPGFQLGYGFVLAGVGGLLGLNRAVAIEALAQGVRTGAANNVLFPMNVVENAPRIISDLKTFFPPASGVFLVGPMAKLGWGTPVLISVSLGIILEIPGDIVILGRVRVNLPTEETALVLLQVTFLGAIEFDKRRIWFFASLFESRVLFMTIDGEMGLLMDFSDNPNFVLSVGGFHPRTTVPALPFPTPKRISISLINESFARVRVEGYFAVTTNSVQFGSKAEMFFGFDALSVDGHVIWDALLQVAPPLFIVEVSAGFSVKVFGIGVYGVRLRGTLEGPAPWHVKGSAGISFLFFDIDVDVDVTFGDPNRDTLPAIAILPLVKIEVEKPSNWVAGLPPSGQLFTSLRSLGEGSAAALVLHPVGILTISQRLAPLKSKLDKVGNQKTSDVSELSFEIAAGSLTVAKGARESFARAQYEDLDDAKKLSLPAFEKLESGVELKAAGGEWSSGRGADRNVRYETIIVDTPEEPVRIDFFEFPGSLFNHFARGASVSRSSVSAAAERKRQPFAEKIEVFADKYAVAFTADNRAMSEATVFESHAEAASFLDAKLRAEPKLAESLHVIPAVEVQRV